MGGGEGQAHLETAVLWTGRCGWLERFAAPRFRRVKPKLKRNG